MYEVQRPESPKGFSLSYCRSICACGFAAAQCGKILLKQDHSIDACGFAAAQCGKILWKQDHSIYARGSAAAQCGKASPFRSEILISFHEAAPHEMEA